MCGISGFFHFDSERTADKKVIKRMNDILFHRGPDGEGFYLQRNLALGHRRLAIIDLNTGFQPMHSEDSQVVVSFNGEIYNYLELRKELELLGCRFQTTSDTEVIIHAYRTWGTDCQQHFNGMWAFALWDEKQKQLFLSRDRMGEKPLYFSRFDNTFLFASEIKSIFRYGMPAEPRLDMTELYMSMGFVPAPYTFYKNIHQLLPGNYLIVTQDGYKAYTYWDLPAIDEKDLRKDKQKIESSFETLFTDAVNIRMRSDVAFGAFLSGGLDSSCVVATMSQLTKKPVETFTIGFENPGYDERKPAQSVARKFRTNHHERVVTPQSIEEAIEKIIFHYDGPFGDPSAIPTGQVSQYASEFVKMVLTGDGGDEVLSGYTTYQGEKFAASYSRLPGPVRKGIPYLLKKTALPLRGNIRYKLNRAVKVLEASNQPFEKRLFAKICVASEAEIDQLLLPNADTVSFYDYYADVMKLCRFQDPFYKLMFFHLKVTLPYDMLTKVDRMSMAYSIETRVPFLDHRIVELLYGVRKDLKMTGYTNKTILRNAIANKKLPEELLNTPKKGFNVPLTHWFKGNNLNDKIKQTLLSDESDFFRLKALSRLVNENKNGESDRGSFIWMALVFNQWVNSVYKKELVEI